MELVDLPFGAEGFRHIVLSLIDAIGGLAPTTAALAATCTHIHTWFFTRFDEDVRSERLGKQNVHCLSWPTFPGGLMTPRWTARHIHSTQEQLEGTQWDDNAGTASPPLQGEELVEFQVAEASRDVEDASPLEDDMTLRHVENNVQALGRYDRMSQDAREHGDIHILRAVHAARQCVVQRFHGKGREDALIAEAMARIRDGEEASRMATREQTRRRKEEAKAMADRKASAAAEAERLAEQRVRLRLQAEAQQREQDSLDAARSFDMTDFIHVAPQVQAARKKRWVAMQRVLLLSRSLDPQRRQHLPRDWGKWDGCNLEDKLHFPSPEAYAKKYLMWIRNLLACVSQGESKKVGQWWIRQVMKTVAKPEFEVPALPPDMLRSATYLVGEAPLAS